MSWWKICHGPRSSLRAHSHLPHRPHEGSDFSITAAPRVASTRTFRTRFSHLKWPNCFGRSTCWFFEMSCGVACVTLLFWDVSGDRTPLVSETGSTRHCRIFLLWLFFSLRKKRKAACEGGNGILPEDDPEARLAVWDIGDFGRPLPLPGNGKGDQCIPMLLPLTCGPKCTHGRQFDMRKRRWPRCPSALVLLRLFEASLYPASSPRCTRSLNSICFGGMCTSCLRFWASEQCSTASCVLPCPPQLLQPTLSWLC